jgi:hypothetical protein
LPQPVFFPRLHPGGRPLAALPAVIISITAPAMFVVELVRVWLAFALVVICPQGWRSQSENGNQPEYCEPASRHK